jgi:hypothetical protein
LTGKPPIRPASTRRRPKQRQRKRGGNPLKNARKLFKQTEPPLHLARAGAVGEGMEKEIASQCRLGWGENQE